MLVLSRSPSDKVLFPKLGITIEILRVQGSRVRIGIDAPAHVAVLRHELAAEHGLAALENIQRQQGSGLSHRERNRLHTAQLALRLSECQLAAGLIDLSTASLQKALRELDMLDEELTANDTTTPRPSEPRKRRALLVEDNANEAELLAAFLRMSGYEVDTASDGLSALVCLSRQQRPDFVLLDMQMPQLDGAETVSSIRSNQDLSDLRIFAVTGQSESDAGVSVGPRGVDRWFRKPFNPERLVATMNRDFEESCMSN